MGEILTPVSESQKKFSRRTFLQGTAAATVAALKTYVDWKTKPWREFFNYHGDVREDFIDPLLKERHWSELATAQYSEAAKRSTRLIVFGDSIGHGRLNLHPDTYYSAGDVIIDVNNTDPHNHWEYRCYAVDGSDSHNLESQLETAIQDNAFEYENIDVMISSGGNDLLHRLNGDDVRETLEQISQGNWDGKILDLPEVIMNEIHAYEERYYQFLNHLKDIQKKGKNINHLIIEGAPNMGIINIKQAELLGLSTAEKERLIETINHYPEINIFLETLSLRINEAMQRAIDKFQSEMENDTHLPILFLNNFDTLTSSNMTGEHPNEEGEWQIGIGYLERTNLISATAVEDSSKIH